MAFFNHPILYRSCGRNINATFALLRFIKKKSGYASECSIDVYTNTLVQETCFKLSDFMSRLPLLKKCREISSCSNKCEPRAEAEELLIRHCTSEEYLNKVLDYLLDGDIDNTVYILKNCPEKSLQLSIRFMRYLMMLFAKLGHLEGVEVVQTLYEINAPAKFKDECGFKYFTAQVLWYRGRYEECLSNIKEMYDTKSSVKAEIKFILYDIMSDSITKRGEASLTHINNFVKQIAVKFDDYYPMAMLWRTLQESEWFADHELSNVLLKEHAQLIVLLQWMIPMWCTYLLNQHKIDAVLRLCEVLLQYNFKDQYSSVLHDLFEYHYNQGDLQRCTSVINSAADLNITLKDTCEKHYLELLINRKHLKAKKSKISLLPKEIIRQINLKF